MVYRTEVNNRRRAAFRQIHFFAEQIRVTERNISAGE
jgi:hypothetical protein